MYKNYRVTLFLYVNRYIKIMAQLQNLRQQLNEAKKKVAAVEDNIRQLGEAPRGTTHRRAFQQQNSGAGGKRARRNRNLSGSSSESDADGDKMQSAIVLTSVAKRSVSLAEEKEKSREDEIAKQSKDGEAQARNRRLFSGLLMGTLRKFKNEMEKQGDVDKKRCEIEQRLEDKQKEEQQLRGEKARQLKAERQLHLKEIREMENKIRQLSEFEEWLGSVKPLSNFIKTETKPSLYWKPGRHNDKSEKLMAKHKKEIEDEIQQKRDEVDDSKQQTENAPKKNRNLLPSNEQEAECSADLPEDDDETSHDLVPAPGGTELLPSVVSTFPKSTAGEVVKDDPSTLTSASNSVLEIDQPTPPVCIDENAQMVPSVVPPSGNSKITPDDNSNLTR